jgi:hypothetical protein
VTNPIASFSEFPYEVDLSSYEQPGEAGGWKQDLLGLVIEGGKTR